MEKSKREEIYSSEELILPITMQVRIGICYVGGMTKDMKKAKDTRTPEQKDSLVKVNARINIQI